MAVRGLGRIQPRRPNTWVVGVVCFALASNVGRLHLSLLSSVGDAADAMLLPQSSATDGTRPHLANAINQTGRIGDSDPRSANSPTNRVDPLQAPSDYPFLVPSDFVPLSGPSTIIYADAEGSARTLLKEAQTPRSIPDDIIDPAIEEARCGRYNLKYSGRKERRRIFYGSTIADDSWHIVSITAMENYGIFHSVALVESNRTHMNNPRDLRFGPGSENLTVLQNGMWGPNVPVTVDLFVNEVGTHLPGWHPAGHGMEGLMRGHIIKRWKKNGMTVDDVGYLADMDEFYTRDYLRAIQICEVKELDAHENCKKARLSATTHIFEGGPECKSSKIIYHPDLTIGACIEGISNSTLHVKPERGWRGFGWLGDGWGPDSGYRKVPKNATHYPLFRASDFRRMPGRSYNAKGFSYNAFHLHNFFADISVLRNKYSTYGEIVAGASEKPLGSIHGDLNVMVVCGLNVSNPVYTKKERWAGGLETLKGPIPLAFQIKGYVGGKMAELKDMLLLDGNVYR
ncbi:hypothetical protein ACHAXT_001831 [Thalassiosira profunda]